MTCKQLYRAFAVTLIGAFLTGCLATMAGPLKHSGLAQNELRQETQSR